MLTFTAAACWLTLTTALATPALASTQSADPAAVVARLFDAYRARDVERLLSLLALDVVFDDPTFRLHREGRDAMREVATQMRAAYADVVLDVHSTVAQSDSVAVELTIAARLARPASDQRIRVRGASFFRVRDGLIYRWTDYFDFRTFSEQTQAPSPSSPPPPRCDSAEHRQFDFWLGEWEVATPDGKPAGRNTITRELNGCVLRERWRGAGGMNGESFNIWDRQSKRWHQTWVSDTGMLLLLDGGVQSNGGMQMRAMSGPPDQRVTNRITWSPAADGGLRQQWEVSADGGRSWKTVFDGRYRRLKGGASPPR
jgi:steroid delta-isomerase-like uncharacterized protein